MNSTSSEIVKNLKNIQMAVRAAMRSTRFFNDQDIEECTSYVMVEMFDYGARTFDASKGSARSHFTCFAFRRAKNWMRSERRRRDFVPVDDLDSSEGGSVYLVADCDPLDDIIRDQDRRGLEKALSSLDEKSKTLIFTYIEHRSWSVAAQAAGVSQATASRMKTKILKKLGMG